MRTLGAAATLCLLTSVAGAVPVASAREDVDGDGTPEAIELDSDGTLKVGARSLKVASDAHRGKLTVARSKARTLIVVDVTRGAKREGIVVDAGTMKEVVRTSLGGVGLDEDYTVELDVTPNGIYRYQTRAGVGRCDGRPAYLYAEGFNGTKFQKLTKLPVGVPATATTLTAKADTAPAIEPLLYHARAASHQVGVADAGGLGIPSELDDGNPTTVWKEELASSAGEGQFFTFEPRVGGLRAKHLRVQGAKGFNRPRVLALVSATGAWRVELPDDVTTAQLVELPQAVEGCVTVILESAYGPERGTTAIAELEVFADGERAGGGDAMLARVVAEGKDAAFKAAAVLARRGAAGAAAIDAEFTKTTDAAARRRLLAVAIKIPDPAAHALLTRAVSEHLVTGPALLDLIDALAKQQLAEPLHAIATDESITLDARVAAAHGMSTTAPGALALLVDLAGTGPREIRKAVIDQLATAGADPLVAAIGKATDEAAAGDLWRALTRHARTQPAARPAALAAMLAALPATTDYERRYRLVDGIASLGDAPALAQLHALLRGLPAGSETSALRTVAAEAIGSTPRPEATALLLTLASDADPGVRLAALRALADVPTDAPSPWHTPDGPDGIDRVMMTALAMDRWPEVRRRAANALGTRCSRPTPAAALAIAVTKDRALDVRIDALTALVQCRAPDVAQLLARVWDDGKSPIDLRTQAVSLAVALEDRALATTLVGKFTAWRGAALESSAALQLAQAAANAIARLDAPGASGVLLAALDDEAFPEIVSAAALALGTLGPKCPPAAKARLRQLAQSEGQVSIAAKRASAQCGR